MLNAISLVQNKFFNLNLFCYTSDIVDRSDKAVNLNCRLRYQIDTLRYGVT